jgi:hypothetical protein
MILNLPLTDFMPIGISVEPRFPYALYPIKYSFLTLANAIKFCLSGMTAETSDQRDERRLDLLQCRGLNMGWPSLVGSDNAAQKKNV